MHSRCLSEAERNYMKKLRVRNVRSDAKNFRFGRHQMRNIFFANRINIRLCQNFHVQWTRAGVLIWNHIHFRCVCITAKLFKKNQRKNCIEKKEMMNVTILLVNMNGIQCITHSQFSLHRLKKCATIEWVAVPLARINCTWTKHINFTT